MVLGLPLGLGGPAGLAPPGAAAASGAVGLVSVVMAGSGGSGPGVALPPAQGPCSGLVSSCGTIAGVVLSV